MPSNQTLHHTYRERAESVFYTEYWNLEILFPYFLKRPQSFGMTRIECVQISWMDKQRFNSELTGTWWKRGRFSVCRKSRTWPLTPAEETGQVLSAWTQADERKSPWKPQQIETLVQARKCLCNPTLLLLTPAAHMKNWYSNSLTGIETNWNNELSRWHNHDRAFK